MASVSFLSKFCQNLRLGFGFGQAETGIYKSDRPNCSHILSLGQALTAIFGSISSLLITPLRENQPLSDPDPGFQGAAMVNDTGQIYPEFHPYPFFSIR